MSVSNPASFIHILPNAGSKRDATYWQDMDVVFSDDLLGAVTASEVRSWIAT
jgi:hypothetical protein